MESGSLEELPVMGTRTWVIIIASVAAIYAGHEHSLAGIYIALAWGGITILLHAIEVKLNKLLDHYGITVWDSDVAKD
jgi:hypothetical protein